MSAWLCSDKHINTLVNYSNVNQLRVYHNGESRECTDLDGLAKELKAENIRSLMERYGNDIPERFESNISFRLIRYTTDPVVILKSCSCYAYQACETGDAYYASFAHAMMEAIRSHAIFNLPGFDKAPWGIE